MEHIEMPVRRQDRRRAGAALAIAGGLLFTAVGAHIGLGEYGARLEVGDVAVDTRGEAAEFALAEGTVLQVQYLDREEARVDVPLTNDGALPVTITGVVGTGPQPRRLMHPVGLADEVRLGPGETRRVTVRLLFTDCEFIGSRSSTVLRELTLHYRTLWRAGTVTVPVRPMVRATSPRDVACPRSTVETRPPG